MVLRLIYCPFTASSSYRVGTGMGEATKFQHHRRQNLILAVLVAPFNLISFLIFSSEYFFFFLNPLTPLKTES